MTVLYLSIAFLIIFFLFFGRYVIARIIFAVKLGSLCRSKNAKLDKTSLFWWLKSINSKNCDFYIEFDKTVFSVKLIGFISKKNMICFIDENHYSRKNMTFQFHASAFQIEYKNHDMPAHNFRYKYNADHTVNWVPCYVVCPKILKLSKADGNSMTELCGGDKTGFTSVYEASEFLSMIGSFGSRL